MRRGFALPELCFVVMTLGVLIAITAPTCDVILRRSHQTEARSMLSTIAHAQHDRDTSAGLVCPADEALPRPTTPFPTTICWKTLGFEVSGVVRYRSSTVLVDARGTEPPSSSTPRTASSSGARRAAPATEHAPAQSAQRDDQERMQGGTGAITRGKSVRRRRDWLS